MENILSDFENYCKSQKTNPKIPLTKKENVKKLAVVSDKKSPDVVELSISENDEEESEKEIQEEIETGEMSEPDLNELNKSAYIQKETQDKEEIKENSEINDQMFKKIITNYSKLNNRDREQAHRIHQTKQEQKKNMPKSPRFKGLLNSGLFS